MMLTVGGAEDREAGQYAAPQLFISSSLTLTVMFLSFERTRDKQNKVKVFIEVVRM